MFQVKSIQVSGTPKKPYSECSAFKDFQKCKKAEYFAERCQLKQAKTDTNIGNGRPDLKPSFKLLHMLKTFGRGMRDNR